MSVFMTLIIPIKGILLMCLLVVYIGTIENCFTCINELTILCILFLFRNILTNVHLSSQFASVVSM